MSVVCPTGTLDTFISAPDAGDAGVLQPGVREEEVDHAPQLYPRSGILQKYFQQFLGKPQQSFF